MDTQSKLNLANGLIEPSRRVTRPLASEMSLRRFTGLTLAGLVAGRPATVSAVSYRAISGYQPGEVALTARGIRAVAFPGSYRSNVWARVAALLTGRRLNEDDVACILRHEAAVAREEFASSMLAAELALADADGLPLAIVYAGFHGFGACVESARRLASRRPDAAVTFVTCDCCLPAKRAALEPLVETGSLRALVVVPSCGGEDEMGEIVTAVSRLP